MHKTLKIGGSTRKANRIIFHMEIRINEFSVSAYPDPKFGCF